MVTIECVTAEQARVLMTELVSLLQDAVDSGASVGFLLPLAAESARDYWQKTIDDIAHGTCLLLVARQGGGVVGTVQLALATQPNAAHRAEVQKLMVHTRVRRQGIGQALMTAVDYAKRTLDEHTLGLA